ITAALSLSLALVTASTASAQLTLAKEAPIVYGHHHLNVTSLAEHEKFWVNGLGGTLEKSGTREYVRFPNVIVMLRQQPPTGGTKGSIVNHIGFQVPNVRNIVEKLRAAGYPIVTKDETKN